MLLYSHSRFYIKFQLWWTLNLPRWHCIYKCVPNEFPLCAAGKLSSVTQCTAYSNAALSSFSRSKLSASELASFSICQKNRGLVNTSVPLIFRVDMSWLKTRCFCIDTWIDQGGVFLSASQMSSSKIFRAVRPNLNHSELLQRPWYSFEDKLVKYWLGTRKSRQFKREIYLWAIVVVKAE